MCTSFWLFCILCVHCLHFDISKALPRSRQLRPCLHCIILAWVCCHRVLAHTGRAQVDQHQCNIPLSGEPVEYTSTCVHKMHGFLANQPQCCMSLSTRKALAATWPTSTFCFLLGNLATVLYVYMLGLFCFFSLCSGWYRVWLMLQAESVVGVVLLCTVPGTQSQLLHQLI